MAAADNSSPPAPATPLNTVTQATLFSTMFKSPSPKNGAPAVGDVQQVTASVLWFKGLHTVSGKEQLERWN